VDKVHHSPHKGIDYALPSGTPIKSIVEGRVEVRNEGTKSYGKSVRIHTTGNRIIIYGHLRDCSVRTGDNVRFGTVIGHSGNTGRSTGPHLHFEVRINGKAINPEPTIWEGMARKAASRLGDA
jgi:murein DD-endopeptidase MepM/ murein hydrolase activator NlpD